MRHWLCWVSLAMFISCLGCATPKPPNPWDNAFRSSAVEGQPSPKSKAQVEVRYVDNPKSTPSGYREIGFSTIEETVMLPEQAKVALIDHASAAGAEIVQWSFKSLGQRQIDVAVPIRNSSAMSTGNTFFDTYERNRVTGYSSIRQTVSVHSYYAVYYALIRPNTAKP